MSTLRCSSAGRLLQLGEKTASSLSLDEGRCHFWASLEYGVDYERSLLRASSTSCCSGLLPSLFCSFPERWKERRVLCVCLVFCQDVGKELGGEVFKGKRWRFGEISSAVLTVAHRVPGWSDEPKERLIWALCSVNLRREARKRTVFRPASYVLWPFPSSADPCVLAHSEIASSAGIACCPRCTLSLPDQLFLNSCSVPCKRTAGHRL